MSLNTPDSYSDPEGSPESQDSFYIPTEKEVTALAWKFATEYGEDVAKTYGYQAVSFLMHPQAGVRQLGQQQFSMFQHQTEHIAGTKEGLSDLYQDFTAFNLQQAEEVLHLDQVRQQVKSIIDPEADFFTSASPSESLSPTVGEPIKPQDVLLHMVETPSN